MKELKGGIIGRIPATLAAAALAATCAVSANAQVLTFKQSPGFYSGSSAVGTIDPATVLFGPGGPPVNGNGGLDFFTAVPDTPLDGKTWTAVSWGCAVTNSASCANAGSSVTPWATFATGFDPQASERSSLEVLGCPDASVPECAVSPASVSPTPGQLNTYDWTPVTVVKHHNHVLSGTPNVLSTVDISSFLHLGPFGIPIDGPGGSVTGVVFTETFNSGATCASPGSGLLPNPVGSVKGTRCDDFAFVSGLDLSPLFIPQGAVGNPTPLQVNFRMTSPGLNASLPGGALVCGAPIGQAPNPDPLCNGYAGPPMVIYTAEGGDNSFNIEAQLSPVITTALFVIGDCEWDQWKPKTSAPAGENNLREVGDPVYFWGSQWWKNNCASAETQNGYPAFKGYATNVAIVGVNGNCGTWEARPGNSGHPPATIPNPVRIIVTDNVLKDGPNISGRIKQIVTVATNPGYGPNPGHAGTGTIATIECTEPPPQ